MTAEVLPADGLEARLNALEQELARRQTRSDAQPAECADGPAPPSETRPPSDVVPPPSMPPQSLRERGNALLRAGDAQGAVELYTQALRPPGGSRSVSAADAATLYGNRAAAQLVLQSWEAACADAEAALLLAPGHLKCLHRLARARAELRHFAQAVAACRAGQQAQRAGGDRSDLFQSLLNQVSTTAALHGSVAAFDGRTLHVRSAGEDAWLCRIAPPSVQHDAAEQQRGVLLAGEETELWSGAGAVPEAALQVARADADAAVALRRAQAKQPLSFRSLQEAVAAAHDGDRIVVQLGHHNCAGSTVEVDKRVLIRGEGRLGDTTVEQRSNSPLMRLSAPAVLQNLVLDLCGFRECLLVEGDARVTPLLEGCTVRCSGDHGVVVSGCAAPTLRGMDVQAQKAGLLTLREARPLLLRCKLGDCGAQGLRACDRSWPQLEACTLSGNKGEGCVAMDAASVQLSGCTLSGNEGPGVDVSGGAHAALQDCQLAGNQGGVFLWDAATARMEGCRLSGGQRHALLADARTRCVADRCVLEGDVLAVHEAAVAGMHAAGRDNRVLPGTQRAMLPPEAGCFKFEADRYTRKQ